MSSASLSDDYEYIRREVELDRVSIGKGFKPFCTRRFRREPRRGSGTGVCPEKPAGAANRVVSLRCRFCLAWTLSQVIVKTTFPMCSHFPCGDVHRRPGRTGRFGR